MDGRPSPAVPELDGHPLLGHVREFNADRLALLDACAAADGPAVRLRLGRPALLLKRAEDVQHVLVTRHAAYPKGPRNVGARARRVFGAGLLTTTSETHRQMRVGVQAAFRRDPVTRLEDGVLRSVDAILDRWRERDEIDVSDEMDDLALRALVGSIFGELSGARADAIEAGLAARHHSMSRAFAWPVTPPGFLPIALRREDREAIRALDAAVDALIRERADERRGGDDLLAMTMAARARSGATDGAQIRAETINLALAAHSNVARALTFTVLALARHPEVDERIRAEVEELVGDGPPTGGVRLPHTEMALAESMRLWPPSALLFRVAREHDVLPSGVRVRAGWKVMLSPYVVQREARYFPDPERFDPERFSAEGRRGRPKYAYFPFGGGPRVCIGQTLSTTICTVALARLAQRAELELAGEGPPYACGCLAPGYGPRMRVRTRVAAPA